MKALTFFGIILFNIAGVGFTAQGSYYFLPFEETFESGSFSTNQWTADTNWTIGMNVGNPGYCAKFNFSPIQTNYESTLTSNYFDADDLDGFMYLEFDLKINSINTTGDEELAIQVNAGNGWIEVAVFNNSSTSYWENHSIDISEPALGSNFRIRFLARGENSLNITSWLLDNLIIYPHCGTPKHLVSSLPDPTHHGDIIELEWYPQAYLCNSGWIYWDAGVNVDAIGLQGGGTFQAAIRFTTEQLTEYSGSELTKMRIFFYGPNGTVVLRVWTGDNANQLILSQPIESYIAGEWNEFTLDSSILITGDTELWLGYEVTHNDTDYVAGVDGGPAVSGYGDLISLDGTVWESMSQAYQLDYNWNIRGWVYCNQNPIELPIGYYIYRDDELIDSTDQTIYLDDDPAISQPYAIPCYKVQAIYEDCVSDFSNESCLGILNVTDIESVCKVYPNPASNNVVVESPENISNLFIYNFSGQLIFQKSSVNERISTLTVNDYPSGIYLLKILTGSGNVYIEKLRIE